MRKTGVEHEKRVIVKILIVAITSFNEVGGAERYAHQFANSLATSLGQANVLLCPIRQKIPLGVIDGQKYTTINPWWCRNRWARRVFHRYLLLRQFDRIIVDRINVAPYAKGLAEFLGVPYDILTHGREVWGNVPEDQMDALSGARTVLTVSSFTRERLVEKGVPSKRIRLLANHIDTGIFYPDPAGAERVIQRYSLQGRRVILTICRLSKERYKGYDRVVKSLPYILQQVSNVVYLIVGTGPDQSRVKRFVDGMGLGDRVIFAGRVSDDISLRTYYSACDVFVMPSRTVISGDICWGEGFGIVYIEANACGKPVVAGYEGGVPDAVIDGVTGLLVDPMDVSSIAVAIVRILKDEELANRLGQQGLRRVRQGFNLDNLQKQVDAYLKIVKAQSIAQICLNRRQKIRKLL